MLLVGTVEDMKDRLNGMFWDVGALSFGIPCVGSGKEADVFYRKNRAAVTWNALSTFEHNPATLSQTEAIMSGRTGCGISQYDMMQVVNYGKAGEELVRLVCTDEFELSPACAAHLHGLAGKEDALIWGRFRDGGVSMQGCSYTPPDADRLPTIAIMGFEYLERQIQDPKERAIAVFLFMSRSQFFYDANKRTASIMMNGCLMRDGFFPITVMNRDAEEFHEKLGRFYETGNANDMMKFFQRQVSTMYPPKEKLPKFD